MKNLKNYLTWLCAFLLVAGFQNSLLAQDETVKKDTIIIVTIDDNDNDDDDDDDSTNINITIGKDKDDHDHDHDHDSNVRFSMLDIGLSTYLYDGSFDLPPDLEDFEQLYGGSLNINWHLFRHRLPIAKRKFGIEYGLTLAWNSYKFDNDFEILENTETFQTVPLDKDVKKNKLKTTFLQVPVMLTWVPGKRESYFVSAGVYGGLMIGSKQKIKLENGDKIKNRDDFNLNKVRYGLEARVGLGPIAFYAQYSLQDLFQDGTGPVSANGTSLNLTPLNIGITVLGF
ncbi:MAG: hypothetical protein ACJAYJ_003771 [Saprospiraceae bacterium]|jgi:hypothetical protein